MTAKQELRENAWAALRAAGAARFPGVEGRIPNFIGAEEAARRLAGSDAWQRAAVVKANPDSPQWPVRTRALDDGKLVYMAVPRLRASEPFWALDPASLDVPARAASSIKGAGRHGTPVAIADMGRIELIVCGSVAVDTDGARLGKGGGYSDLEFALAAEAGLVGDWTTIATTVHPSQVWDPGRIPMTGHDFPVDLIATPESARATGGKFGRPAGMLWNHLDEDRIADIPVLSRMRPR